MLLMPRATSQEPSGCLLRIDSPIPLALTAGPPSSGVMVDESRPQQKPQSPNTWISSKTQSCSNR